MVIFGLVSTINSSMALHKIDIVYSSYCEVAGVSLHHKGALRPVHTGRIEPDRIQLVVRLYILAHIAVRCVYHIQQLVKILSGLLFPKSILIGVSGGLFEKSTTVSVKIMLSDSNHYAKCHESGLLPLHQGIVICRTAVDVVACKSLNVSSVVALCTMRSRVVFSLVGFFVNANKKWAVWDLIAGRNSH